MYKITFLFIILLSLYGCAQKTQSEALAEAKEFQYEINLKFADKETSPLTKKDFMTFSSLNFFDVNESLRIEADFTRTPNEEPFDMLTTTSRLAKYVKYGMAKFTLDNKPLELAIYKDASDDIEQKYKDHLFLPFTDLSNGKESYAGGRFIDLSTNDIKDGKIAINFNTAYNPYCAYSDRYSCPIPPKENHLEVAILAGVKKFKKGHE